MSYYNTTFLDNITNPAVLAEGLNTASDGLLFPLILFFLWFILFMSFGQFDIKDRFLASSFLISIGGGFLLAAGLIEWWLLVFPAIATFIGVILKIWGDS